MAWGGENGTGRRVILSGNKRAYDELLKDSRTITLWLCNGRHRNDSLIMKINSISAQQNMKITSSQAHNKDFNKARK